MRNLNFVVSVSVVILAPNIAKSSAGTVFPTKLYIASSNVSSNINHSFRKTRCQIHIDITGDNAIVSELADWLHFLTKHRSASVILDVGKYRTYHNTTFHV